MDKSEIINRIIRNMNEAFDTNSEIRELLYNVNELKRNEELCIKEVEVLINDDKKLNEAWDLFVIGDANELRDYLDKIIVDD